ncbi:MAG: hypothetical protein JWO99_236 [Candidatus Saccharibacteria bacterium]|nr:hypothetical protein [Candidatus Saccharibacteria bacterium]
MGIFIDRYAKMKRAPDKGAQPARVGESTHIAGGLADTGQAYE